MANAQWPVSLPQKPISGGFTESPRVNVLRSDMDVGPPKLRRRSTAAIRIMQLAFEMTATQVATFETFFYTTLKDGSLQFDIAHPRTGANKAYRFVPGQEPKIDHQYVDTYKVTMAWEELP